MVETAAQKRKAEDATAAMTNETLGQSDQPASKKVKLEDATTQDSALPVKSEAPAAADAGMTGTLNEVNTAADSTIKQDLVPKPEIKEEIKPAIKREIKPENVTEVSEAQTDSDPSQTLGYKTFQSGDEAFQYFHTLVHDLRHDQDVNEYEFHAVLDLVKQGHPEPDTKIGSGIRAIQVREHEQLESTCFYLLRNDGTDDNFSVRKCICKLFPKWGEKNQRQPNDFTARGGGRGAETGGTRGGSGRAAGGRGGRGGRRGRGRGRGRARF